MKILSDYFKLQEQIYKYFGYEENWVVLPLEDNTEHYWYLKSKSGEPYKVWFSEKPFTVELIKEGAELYSNYVYTQRFLDKWVYRKDDYTMICVDTRTDNNKFLAVFDNSKELKKPSKEMLEAFNLWE